MGNYKESSKNNEEKLEDHKNNEDSRTTEFPTSTETDLFLSTTDEIATVTTATSDAPDDDDDNDDNDDGDDSDDDDDDDDDDD